MSFLDRLRLQKRLKDSSKKFQVVIPVYSIYDKKSQTYSPPFLASGHSVAVRMVHSSCNDSNSFLALYPHDYRLDQIGFFCEATGVISSLDEKEIVSEVSNIVGISTPTGDELNGSKEDY